MCRLLNIALSSWLKCDSQPRAACHVIWALWGIFWPTRICSCAAYEWRV